MEDEEKTEEDNKKENEKIEEVKEETEKEELEKENTKKKDSVGKLTEEDILGKEKSEIEKEPENKQEEEKSHNKIMRGFLIGIISFAIMFVIVIFIVKSTNNFSYRGVEFEVDRDEMIGKTLYRTSIPVQEKNSITGKIISNADYRFWLRNDPRELDKKVPIINGDLTFTKNIVLDLTTEELFCEGDWVIAFANTVKLLQILGFNVSVKDEKTKYEPAEKYMFITIQIGNSTNIEKKFSTMNLENKEVETENENSYNLNINNCEVLPAFERLMIEAFVKYQEVT